MKLHPKMFVRYYRPEEEDEPVIECLSTVAQLLSGCPIELNTITYELDFESPVSFLDCLLIEAEAKCPNCLILKSCQIQSFSADEE